MNGISRWLEKYMLPIANKIGSQRHLSAVKNGFIATMPIALVGALSVMFNNVFLNSTSLLGELLNRMSFYANTIQPFWDRTLIPIFGQIWWATIAMAVLFSTFTIAYNFAKEQNEDGLAAGVIAIAAYLTLVPQVAAVDGVGDVWGLLSWNFFNSQAVFAGLITALISAELFCFVKRKGWIIKMPAEVPPAVSKAFSAVIPAAFVLFLFSIVSIIWLNVIEMPLPEWINHMLQQPLVRLGQSPLTLIFLMIIQQILWFFGIHGMMVIEPALTLMYGPTLAENTELVMQGLQPIHVITRNFLDVYAMHGGSGATLGLIVSIFFFSKKAQYRMLAKMAVPPGVFQINEPIIYGLPIVLNPLMVIPFVFIPAINIFIAWFFTAVIPFAGLISVGVPWTTPPIISAFLATNGSITATILAAATFALSVILYAPFVIAANKEDTNSTT